jgi:hypothetical protein
MIALFLGKKGSRKSALLRKICWRALQQRAVILFHDPQCNLNDAAGKVYAPRADGMHPVSQFAADTDPAYCNIFRGCEAEDVAALALKLGRCTLVLDEMDQVFSHKGYIAGADSAVRKIIHEGRHYGVCLMGTFRRTASVSEDLVSQCDYVFLFRTTATAPQDIVTIRQRFGEAFANVVPTLDVGKFVIWTDA